MSNNTQPPPQSPATPFVQSHSMTTMNMQPTPPAKPLLLPNYGTPSMRLPHYNYLLCHPGSTDCRCTLCPKHTEEIFRPLSMFQDAMRYFNSTMDSIMNNFGFFFKK